MSLFKKLENFFVGEKKEEKSVITPPEKKTAPPKPPTIEESLKKIEQLSNTTQKEVTALGKRLLEEILGKERPSNNKSDNGRGRG